jgi:hypothetical protein|nr:MAG TPA: Protein of unknown function (DUF1642) [Caudoviricetes sp.]
MNKKELIEKIEAMPNNTGFIRPKIDKHLVLGLIRQLDEPEKVKVSEEEAKFLETFNLNHRIDVATALYHVSRVGWGYYLTDNNDIELKDLSEEFNELENRKRLIKAILNGYEVEKEKRYWVKLKAVDQYLVSIKDENFLGFLHSRLRTKFTRKQLEEADFGWVFDCEGIEIEEVEE